MMKKNCKETINKRREKNVFPSLRTKKRREKEKEN